MRRVYYAHAICLYDQADERGEVGRIRKRFPRATVVNPKRYDDHPEKLADTMGFCLKLVDKCDVVVFSRVLGKITAGVGKEVNYALKNGKPVFELSADKIKPCTRPVKHISRFATRTLYKKYRFILRAALYAD